MTFISNLPAIVRVGLAFILILVAIRHKLSLGNSFFLGAVALSVFFGFGPLKAMHSMVASIIDPKTLCLALIVSLILILSNSMQKAGQMTRLLTTFRGLVAKPGLNLTLFPALMGLLPMPGGAVFSAPMVKEIGSTSDMSGSHLSFVNYWFRHIWDAWWPLYPGVLMTAILSNISLVAYCVLAAPVTLIVIFLGQRSIAGLQACIPERRSRRTSIRPFLKEIVPILIVIIPGLGSGMILSAALPSWAIAKESGLILSLGAAIIWVWRENRFDLRQIRAVMLDRHLLQMFYMIAAIWMFKGILTDTRAVDGISRELLGLHIPLFCIVVSLTFLVGMVTGINIAFVGGAFPILIPMIQAAGEMNYMAAYMVLAMVCGCAGVMLSPLHLCMLLSNNYFHASQGSFYRQLWLPCTGLVAFGMIYFWGLHWGLGRL